MKRRKLIPSVAALALMLASCAPQAFVLSPEMRSASKSGLNMSGKSMAVVYVTDNSEVNEAFSSNLVDGFATRLEEDYFGGEPLVEVFKMTAVTGADYSSKDSLVNLVLDTGKDVVFLLDRPELGTPSLKDAVRLSGTSLPADSSFISTAALPFVIDFYVYDSMNSNDKVYAFRGSKEMKPTIYSDGTAGKEELSSKVWENLSEPAYQAGRQAAASFVSTWKQESFYVIYYDMSEGAWTKGAEYAYIFQWGKAIEEWMTLVNNKNPEKRACACYNVALGCFMAGQQRRALEWIDRSDQYTPFSLSKTLRDKIKEYTGQE